MNFLLPIEALTDEDESVRKEVLRSLEQMGLDPIDDLLPILRLRAASHENSNVRLIAEKVAREIDPPPAEPVASLEEIERPSKPTKRPKPWEPAPKRMTLDSQRLGY